MSAGILELDRLAVGLIELYGKAWHNHPNCQHLEGVVPVEKAQEIFGYHVDKVQLQLPNGTPVLGAHALVRMVDNGDGTTRPVVLFPAVGERYTEIQNDELLKWIKAAILDQYQVSIESVGTLLNGQTAFLNIILNEHIVKGDHGKTVTRMMYSNSFGGSSVQACVHSTRIVCQNTLRMASAQGAAGNTLKKFRHTINAAEKVEAHLVDLADIVAKVRDHNANMDNMVSQRVTTEDVNNFLNALIPVPNEDGRGKTMATNKRQAILNLFENKPDLQGEIARTRYALLQATTDYADHESQVRNGDDEVGRFWDGVWGIKDGFKQKALDLLMVA